MPSILIVDDDELVRIFLRRLLEKKGFEVTEACNGMEGFNLYQASCPDLVLIDIVMPVKDGITTLKEIKRLNKKQKIIAISGGSVFTPGTYLDEAEKAGADCVIPKPFCQKSLVRTINMLLG